MLGLFKSKKFTDNNSSVYKIKLVQDGKQVRYGDVDGFFAFRGKVYYRVKGSSGKSLDNLELSFTDSLKATYPEEFSKVLAKDISRLLVQPLKIEK